MRLNLLTFNARGFNDEAAIDSLHRYLHNFQPRLDIVAIQEHKLRRDAFTRLDHRIWCGAEFFGGEASPGYGHASDAAGVGCDGVATFLAFQWARIVSQSGTLHYNRIHWFVLSGLPGGDVGVTNVYAPNDSPSYCEL
jgi:exonuclease III